MPAGAFGAVRPVGAILPTATAAGPIPLTKPRTATPLRRPLPASHVWTMNYFCDWPRKYGIDLNKKGEWYCGKLRCLSKTWLHLRDKSTRILWDIHVVWTRALWFSTLLATAVLYYILTIRKLANTTNVKRQVRKGVLAWAFGRTIHIIYWHTINYRQKKQNQQMSRGSKTIHILENITGSKTIHILKNQSWFCNNIVTWKK